MCLLIFYIKKKQAFLIKKSRFLNGCKIGDNPILVKNWKLWTFFFSDKVFNGNVFGNVSYDEQPILDYNIGDFW